MLRLVFLLFVLLSVAAAAQPSLVVGPELVGMPPTTQDTSFFDVAAGGEHSVALRSDGSVVVWGGNSARQLMPLVQAMPFGAVAAGSDFVIALRSNEEGFAAGWGAFGQGPGRSPTFGDIVQISAGENHAAYVRTDGSVITFDRDFSGLLDPPTGLGRVRQSSVGSDFMAVLLEDSTVAAWGVNTAGQTDIPTSLDSVVQISAGTAHVVALRADSTVVQWGAGGQTGPPLDLGGVVQVSAGAFYTLARLADSTVVAWGTNAGGRTEIPQGLQSVVDISAGATHALALRADGTIEAWGSNTKGEATLLTPGRDSRLFFEGAGEIVSFIQADGSIASWVPEFDSPGEILTPEGLDGVVEVSVGGAFTVARRSDSTVVAWGDNEIGQTDVPEGLSGVTQVAAGFQHVLALKADSTVVAWGNNVFGQTDIPIDLDGVVAVKTRGDGSVAIRSDGSIVTWGSFRLPGDASFPESLNRASDVVDLAFGALHTMALHADGTITAWGFNGNGEIDVPAELSDVVWVDLGFDVSYALRADGRLFAWGANRIGETDVPEGLSPVLNATPVANRDEAGFALVVDEEPRSVVKVQGVTGTYTAAPGELLTFDASLQDALGLPVDEVSLNLRARLGGKIIHDQLGVALGSGTVDYRIPEDTVLGDTIFVQIRADKEGYQHSLAGVAIITVTPPVSNEQAETPAFSLLGAAPNPSPSSTRLQLDLPADSEIELVIYDMIGRRVAHRSSRLFAGRSRSLATPQLPPGTYVYRVEARSATSSESAVGTFTIAR